MIDQPYRYPSGFYVGQKIIIIAPRIIVSRKYCEIHLVPNEKGEVIYPPNNYAEMCALHDYGDAVNVRLPGRPLLAHGYYRTGLVDSFLLMPDTEFTDLAMLIREAEE